MTKKVIFCAFVIFVAWIVAIFVHDMGVYFYKKHYFFQRDVSWGILVHLVFKFLYPISLIFSAFLFFWKKKTAIIPFLILFLYVGFTGWGYRPLRTILILTSISLGYFLLFISFRKIEKKSS